MKSPTKRTLAVFLVGIVAILAFAACSSTDEATDAPAASEPAAPAQEAAAAAPAQAAAAATAVPQAAPTAAAPVAAMPKVDRLIMGVVPLSGTETNELRAQFVANCLAIPVRLRLPDSAERGNRATDAWSCRVMAD